MVKLRYVVSKLRIRSYEPAGVSNVIRFRFDIQKKPGIQHKLGTPAGSPIHPDHDDPFTPSVNELDEP